MVSLVMKLPHKTNTYRQRNVTSIKHVIVMFILRHQILLIRLSYASKRKRERAMEMSYPNAKAICICVRANVNKLATVLMIVYNFIGSYFVQFNSRSS